jgi:Asp-tRNA(Asn)/Glu-tRNA(Gln) amidotransferase A subunit family amidase
MTTENRLTASQARPKLNDGSLTVEAYARSLISYISERDAIIHAWAYLNPDQVIERAKELDRLSLEERGPLHGVPIAVKDVLLTKDMPTQYNSAIYNDDAPKLDAAAVKILRSSGALLFGMC